MGITAPGWYAFCVPGCEIGIGPNLRLRSVEALAGPFGSEIGCHSYLANHPTEVDAAYQAVVQARKGFGGTIEVGLVDEPNAEFFPPQH